MAWDVIIYKIYKIWFCIVFFILYFNNNINLNIVTALPLIRNYKSLDQSYLTKAIKDIASLSSDSTDKDVFHHCVGYSYDHASDILPNPVHCPETALCRARCVARCDDIAMEHPPVLTSSKNETPSVPGIKFCKNECETFQTDDWIQDCENRQCINNCGSIGEDDSLPIGDKFIPGPPSNLSLYQWLWIPTHMTIRWRKGQTKSRHSVLHVVETSINNQWVFVNMTSSAYITTLLDVCEIRDFRVASVNQFGNDGYSKITRSELPIPGRVSEVSEPEEPWYNPNDSNFHQQFIITLPIGWSETDLQECVFEYEDKKCSNTVLPPPPITAVKKNPDGSGTYIVDVAVLETGYDCIYYFHVYAVSKCGINGMIRNVMLNLTDCLVIENFACPEGPFVWPDIVQNITIDINNDNMEVNISWNYPDSSGSCETIEYFIIQWGYISYLKNLPQFQKPQLEEEGRIIVPGDELNALIHVNWTNIKYGLKIVAIVPEQVNQTESINRYIDQQPSMAEFIIEDDVNSTNPKSLIIYLVVPTLAVVISIAAVSIFFISGKKKAKNESSNPPLFTQHSGGDDSSVFKQVEQCMQHNPFYEGRKEDIRVLDQWEIDRKYVTIGDVLGRGAFGQVLKGVVKVVGIRNLRKTSSCSITSGVEDVDSIVVAVKMLLSYAGDTYKSEFMKEIDLMKSIGYHPNVVSIIGCVTKEEPICLIVEHISEGDLLHYLRKHRQVIQQENSSDSGIKDDTPKLTLLDIMSIARQISVGMEFLSQKGFVHRDLACRNILVGDNKLVKIGDFGLTRYIYDDKIYVTKKGGKLPLKWMAMESIFDLTFTSASDVWSFGVVLFELITLGGAPYPAVANRDLLRELRNGYRMEQPDNCPAELYEMMTQCWQTNPTDRPTFTDLRNSLDALIENNSHVEYMSFEVNINNKYYKRQDDEESVSSNDNDEMFISNDVTEGNAIHQTNHFQDLTTVHNSDGRVSPARKLLKMGKGKIPIFLHTPLSVLRKSADDLYSVSNHSMQHLLPSISSYSSSSDPGYDLQRSWVKETKF